MIAPKHERNLKIVRLRDAGESFAAIGEMFNMSRQCAHNKYKKYKKLMLKKDSDT